MQTWNRLCSLKNSQLTKQNQSRLSYQLQGNIRDGSNWAPEVPGSMSAYQVHQRQNTGVPLGCWSEKTRGKYPTTISLGTGPHSTINENLTFATWRSGLLEAKGTNFLVLSQEETQTYGQEHYYSQNQISVGRAMAPETSSHPWWTGDDPVSHRPTVGSHSCCEVRRPWPCRGQETTLWHPSSCFLATRFLSHLPSLNFWRVLQTLPLGLNINYHLFQNLGFCSWFNLE